MIYFKDIQYSIFTNNQIEPSAEFFLNMLPALNSIGNYQFLPSTIAGKNIDLLSGKINTINNVSFVSTDKCVQISCLNDRIDVLINRFENSQFLSIDDYIEFSRNALIKLMTINHIFSNRLAINISLISGQIKQPLKETKLGKRFCNTFDYYTDSDLEEWSSRVNARKIIEVDNKEPINVITDLSSFVDNSTKTKKFLCHMDINTIFENAGYRFNSESLKKFDVSVSSIVKEISGNFEELSNDL